MVKPGSPASLWGAAGKAGYALSCVAAALVLAISGFSYFVVKDVGSIGGSHAIVSGPSIGAQNILLMGLESRTDWNGNILPDDVLEALHACNRQEIENGCGGNDTNTLILIHIPAGGKKAVGFSIPRDDWVTFAGTLGSSRSARSTRPTACPWPPANPSAAAGPGHQPGPAGLRGQRGGPRGRGGYRGGAHRGAHRSLRRDQPGRVLRAGQGPGRGGGLPQPPGAAGSQLRLLRHAAGYQHLSPKLALAFVRQRDGLPNGDLDRTHRQQAFLDSVLAALRTEGVLDDLTKVQALLSVAKQYVITDSGWNLLDFVSQMRNLTSGNLTFRTLPIESYADIGGQDANVVNPSYIKQLVQETFYPAPAVAGPKPATSSATTADAGQTTVDVYNGGNTPGLAGLVSAALVKQGYKAGQIANATSALTTTEVVYGTGSSAAAAKIASLFGVTAAASSSVAAGHVELLLGADATLAEVAPARPPRRARRCPSRPPARRAARSTPRTASPAWTDPAWTDTAWTDPA